MRTWLASGALTVTVAAVAMVGLLDAVFIEEHDFAALFGLTVALALVQLVVWARGRRAVTLRADVARWLRVRSQLSGEPADRLADRVLTAHLRVVGDAVPADEPGSGAPSAPAETTGPLGATGLLAGAARAAESELS